MTVTRGRVEAAESWQETARRAARERAVSLTTMSGPAAAPSSPRSLPIPPWAITALAAAVGSLVYATHLYLYHRLQGQPASFPEELAEAAVHFGAWAALIPLVLRLARRWELLERRWPSTLLLHLGLGLVVALVQLLLHTLLDQVFIHGWEGASPFLEAGRRFFVRTVLRERGRLPGAGARRQHSRLGPAPPRARGRTRAPSHPGSARCPAPAAAAALLVQRAERHHDADRRRPVRCPAHGRPSRRVAAPRTR